MVRVASPARRSAQTVTAMPPAPAAPKMRVAACPAMVIS
jgi:hypothetical protein